MLLGFRDVPALVVDASTAGLPVPVPALRAAEPSAYHLQSHVFKMSVSDTLPQFRDHQVSLLFLLLHVT